MKTLKKLFYLIPGILLLGSCSEYLDKTPEAQITEKDIFGTYISFQGFVDPIYYDIIDYPQLYLWNDWNGGGDVIDRSGGTNAYQLSRGSYLSIIGPSSTSVLWNNRQTYGYGITNVDDKDCGIWWSGWRGIRRSNLALKNFGYLSEATQEEKDLLKGQIYFFRAFFHGEIIQFWGGMPYVDTVYNASDELRAPRLTYQECTERIIEDLDRAIPLLPLDWDLTGPGSQRVGANAGRITKGAALAYKQKFLLYAASPLMNKYSGNDYEYNIELCKRAAAAGWEALNLANTMLPAPLNRKVYELLPFNKYNDMFFKTDGTMPWTTETILQRVERESGSGRFANSVRRIYVPSNFGGTEYCHGVNQLFVDRFEMADGTRYKVEYDTDNSKRWLNRDPRFKQSILVDRDKHGNHVNAVAKLWEGPGSTKTAAGQAPLPYLVKKYWPWGVNDFDQLWGSYRYINPRMRLAEVYLDYAEAVTAAYGANGSAPTATLTAVDAINIIRTRAGMPNVTSAATGYIDFMELVRNERCVELCFESHYWFDMRRWYLAHLPENKVFIDLQFPQNWSSFNRVKHIDIIFDDPKHYWMPIYKTTTLIYPEMKQNPGWE